MTFLKRAAAMAVTMVFLFSAAGAHATIVNRVAAVVDDQMITLLEVETASKPIVQAFANSPEAQKIDSVDLQARISEIKMKMLKEMIEQKLLEAEVKRLGIPVSDREIDEFMDRIKKANRLTDEQLTASLAAEGTSLKDFREQVKLQILREQYVAFRLKNKIEITEEEARAYYKQNHEEFEAEPVVALSEIRISIPPDATEADIEEAKTETSSIFTQLLAGADFAQTAKQHSSGPTASSGGSLGTWKIRTELAPNYRNAAESLKPGQMAPPYRDEKGYVILKCDKWENSGFLPFDDVKDKIQNQLRRQSAEREMEKLSKELYKKSFVDIKIEKF